MRNTVIFTGLPREEELFRQSISELSELQDLVDQILFVTWEERFDPDSDLGAYLDSHGVETITAPESPLAGDGNIWHQMKALDLGLQETPDDHWVLKTRTDVHIDKQFLERLLGGERKRVYARTEQGAFEHRVWAPLFDITKPFLVSDICFFGSAVDIRQLVNYDARYETLYELGANRPEKRRYVDPYIEEFPMLKTYYRQYLRHGWGAQQTYINRHKLLGSRARSRLFGSLLGLYYKLMCVDFDFEAEPVQFRQGEIRALDPPQSSDYLTTLSQGPVHTDYLLACKQTEWLTETFGEPEAANVPDPVITGFERPFEVWREFEPDPEEIAAEIQTHREFVDTSDGAVNRPLDLLSKHVLDTVGAEQYTEPLYRFLAE